MRFWDASAIVPLCLDQPVSATVRSLLAEDASMIVWWSSRIECASAFARLAREKVIDAEGARRARDVLAELARRWAEVQPTEPLRLSAERLLGLHVLRTADALQLAAALDWCEARTTGIELVTFDARLREAANREGFVVLPSA